MPTQLGNLPQFFPSILLQASMASEKADLDTEVCHARAAECRRLASATDSPPLQIMLDHIAETWLRIAKQLIG